MVEWCPEREAHPAKIERTVAIRAGDVGNAEACLAAGAQQIILSHPHPFNLRPVQHLLEAARGSRARSNWTR